MRRMYYTLLLSICIFLITNVVQAQTDTEFWFAAPEAIEGHGDRPIYIRIATLGQGGSVTVSQPANPSFPAQTVTIAANSSYTMDLTGWIDQIENKPANTVLNYGLHIESTVIITAYYEIMSVCMCNPEIFALKGSNALGTEFYTPFQTFTSNGYTGAYSSFDIVATENNTTVTITPTADIVGHTAGTPFSVTLNKGQTYSATATSQAVFGHPAGSYIVSNKPIAVTVKDDSLNGTFWGGCQDITGDQIVPVEIVGMKYIVMRGFLNNNIDKVFVLATVDNTSIYVDGSGTAAGLINAGETFTLTITNLRTFIETTQPVYVLQLSGFGCELGGPLLPPIDCTGSNQVSFIRATEEFFGLNIMCRNGFQNSFVMNGSSTLVPASAFVVVPGTNSEWVSAQISFTSLQVPAGVASSIVNSNGLFHVGIINGGASSGARFGYFSDYGKVDLGPDLEFCYGNTIQINSGLVSGTFLWSTGDTTPVITVDTAGIYLLSAVQSSNCILEDTIQVSLLGAVPHVSIGNDTTVCTNTELLLSAQPVPFCSYTWNGLINNQFPVSGTGMTFPVDKPGTYAVTVNGGVCGVAKDTIHIIYNELGLELGNDLTNVCITNPVVLNATVPQAGYPLVQYHWSNYAVSPTITALASGIYSVSATRGNCTEMDTIHVNYVSPLSINLGPDAPLCADSTLSLSAGIHPYAGYLWSTGGSNSSIQVSNPGTYGVTVTNGCGSYSDTRVLYSLPAPVVDLGPDITICAGTPAAIESNLSGVTYSWSTGSNYPSISVSQSGYYTLTASNSCGSGSDQVYVYADEPLLINLGPDTTVCPGFVLQSGVNAQNYFWSNGQTSSSILITSPGLYLVEAENTCGTGADQVFINLYNENLHLGPDTVLCYGQSMILNPGMNQAYSYQWSNGSFNPYLYINQADTISLQLTTYCGILQDTIIIQVLENSYQLGNDTSICAGESIQLSMDIPGGNFHWSDGSVQQQLSVTQAGSYWVQVQHSCGNFADTIQISQYPANWVDLGDDTLYLEAGSTLVLDAGGNFQSYWWSTNQNNQTISVSIPGLYWVNVTDENGCSSVDTVQVIDRQAIEVPGMTDFTLYPNPTEGVLYIQGEGLEGSKMLVRNELGQVVLTNYLTNQNSSVRMDFLPSGIYYIQLVREDVGGIIFKVMKISN